MQVVVLAAGQGTRLRPLTGDRPKSMLNVAGRPLLHSLLEDLGALGVAEVILVVGHGHGRIRAYAGDGVRFGLKITYVQQERQLGSGHALQQAAHLVTDREFLLLPADAWYHRDLIARLLAAAGPTLLQAEGLASSRHGVTVLEAGKVVDLLGPEEGHDGLPSGGAYRLPRRILEALQGGNHRLRDAIRTDLASNGPWTPLRAAAHEYIDLVEVSDLLRLNALLLERLLPSVEGRVEAGAVLSGAVHVGEGSLVRAGCVVTGPVSIGRHCDIGPGAVLNPGTALRNHVRIGPLAFLQNCTLGSNVVVGPQARIQDAALDNGVHVGPGAHIDGG
ncbi:MAG TPA: sugar phosphate nucleotidyltransferase, partial [Candidatus Thermoplasmatota archaeon]|nr:sugar phosphate nucleotidyltransferase [Candidatus Thermoplasmatota archaeon]